MPRVPKLFIDKLVITVRFDSSRAEAVRQAIEDSFEWSDAIEPIDIDISNYSENFQFVAPNGHKATLQMGPRNRRNNNFRLEYSPNNLGAAGRAALGEYLRDTLGDGYLTDIRNGRLTRLDLAFDVRRIRLKDLMIVDLRGRKTSIIRGEQGEVETYPQTQIDERWAPNHAIDGIDDLIHVQQLLCCAVLARSVPRCPNIEIYGDQGGHSGLCGTFDWLVRGI